MAATRSKEEQKEATKDYQEAADDYTLALKLKPDSYTYAGRGWAYVASNNFNLALKDFDEAVKLDNDNGYAYSGRGYVRVKQDQLRLGLADAEEALRRGPESLGLLHNVARTYAQAVGRLDKGLNAQTSELRFQYQDNAVQLLRRVVDKLPRKEQAAFWNKYVKTDPDLEPIRRAQKYLQLEADVTR